MQVGRISHVEDEPIKVLRCANIKSRKDPKKQCTNSATHGEFCGIHYKHPRPWVAKTPEQHKRINITFNPAIVIKILKWWRNYRGLYLRRRQGPAYWIRNICVNDCDFFSTEYKQHFLTIFLYLPKSLNCWHLSNHYQCNRSF
jgi:hypothetical protein